MINIANALSGFIYGTPFYLLPPFSPSVFLPFHYLLSALGYEQIIDLWVWAYPYFCLFLASLWLYKLASRVYKFFGEEKNTATI